MSNLPKTLNELATHLMDRVKIAEAVDNQYFFVETWEIKSILMG